MPVWPPGEAYSHPPKASYGVASLDRVSLRTCLKSGGVLKCMLPQTHP